MMQPSVVGSIIKSFQQMAEVDGKLYIVDVIFNIWQKIDL